MLSAIYTHTHTHVSFTFSQLNDKFPSKEGKRIHHLHNHTEYGIPTKNPWITSGVFILYSNTHTNLYEWKLPKRAIANTKKTSSQPMYKTRRDVKRIRSKIEKENRRIESVPRCFFIFYKFPKKNIKIIKWFMCFFLLLFGKMNLHRFAEKIHKSVWRWPIYYWNLFILRFEVYSFFIYKESKKNMEKNVPLKRTNLKFKRTQLDLFIY